MSCSYCLEEAQFRCGCRESYMCQTHLTSHKNNMLTTFGEHEDEELTIDSGQSRLQELRTNILKRIKSVDEAINLMAQKTQFLIQTIKKVHKRAKGSLNGLREECLDILKHNKFCKSEFPKIKKIEIVKFDVKLVEIDEILASVENVFGVEITKYLDKSKAREK